MQGQKRCFVSATITLDLWDDVTDDGQRPGVDYVLHSMAKKLRIGLLNEGLAPWGRPVWNYKPREKDLIYLYHADPFVLVVWMWQYGVPLQTISPTEWDTCC